MWIVLVMSALAQDACTYVGFGDVVGTPAPAVIVLGERHGFQPDLSRAAKVVRTLSQRGPVRVALEAVNQRYQPVLDRFERLSINAADLSTALEWDTSWGVAYRPYAPLVEAAVRFGGRTQVVGAGVDLGPMPDNAQVPVPPRYLDLLRPAMEAHPLPMEQEASFVQAMAWRDYAIASNALKGWDGKGYLVIVTGRGHVEGGKGVAWQAERLTQVPVSAFVLVPGKEPPCHTGDKLWR